VWLVVGDSFPVVDTAIHPPPQHWMSRSPSACAITCRGYGSSFPS